MLEACPLGGGNYAMAQAIVNTDSKQFGSFMGPRLIKGSTNGVAVTLTSANTDYVTAAAMPAGTKYVGMLGKQGISPLASGSFLSHPAHRQRRRR